MRGGRGFVYEQTYSWTTGTIFVVTSYPGIPIPVRILWLLMVCAYVSSLGTIYPNALNHTGSFVVRVYASIPKQ